MWQGLISQYLWYEAKALGVLRRVPYMEEYTYDPISARITLFLAVVGTLAFFNELYITIEMSFLQKKTYNELNAAALNAELLKNHRMILDDEFHGKEWLDEKSGIVIEEFETRDRFFAKPVHVAHLYVECNVVSRCDIAGNNLTHEEGKYVKANGPNLLSKPFRFHIEFSPEEYELEKRPEFGCRLDVLRRKLYHFFKETDLHEQFVVEKNDTLVNEPFSVSRGVQIYNTSNELLPTTVDDIQLCFLKMETGDTIKCKFVV
ncbi:LANO_0H02916g1_1 [Lachancea nothofagi CBS 11611]|uniref:LANO_0H02916g1_1 n=1 Tax=Lachancea nothofagi CBS 11611 TaxID=1266666 RepID=A0A1G4KKY2_9SACH|nr:LANO_0H02916g1_1 [Lachancea nothofagi CBS 11611]